MKTVAIVVVVLVVLLVIVLAVLAGRRNSRRAALRERFGPEYDLALKRGKDRRAVEQRLEQLAKQRDQLDIREVPVQEHVQLARDWDGAQSRFVDDPGQAVADADGLVNSVMRSRGYPVESFDDRAALMATDHQDVVESYRSAHDTFASHLQGGSHDTEALRQAFLHYREVFGRLNAPDGEVGNAREQEAVAAAPVRREVEAAPVAVEAPVERPVHAGRREESVVERPVDADKAAGRGEDRRGDTVIDRRDDAHTAVDRGEDGVVDRGEHGVADGREDVERPVDVGTAAGRGEDRREDTVIDLRDDARTAADRGEDPAPDTPVDQPAAAADDDQSRQRRVAAHRADPD